jgi:hypothetical protein
MAKVYEVLEMLCKGVEYVYRGENYEDIDWLGEKPAITKAKFEAGFAQYDAFKAEQDAAQTAAKSALLDRLGMTEDEAKLLLS